MYVLDEEKKIDLRLHHIAYATRSTDESIKMFRHIYPSTKVYRKFEQSQNVYYSYLCSETEPYMIELVEPRNSPNPVDNLLKDIECALYHICYKVDDFQKGIEHFKMNGYFMVTKPFEPEFEEGIIVCHFFRPETGIIEIMGDKV